MWSAGNWRAAYLSELSFGKILPFTFLVTLPIVTFFKVLLRIARPMRAENIHFFKNAGGAITCLIKCNIDHERLRLFPSPMSSAKIIGEHNDPVWTYDAVVERPTFANANCYFLLFSALGLTKPVNNALISKKLFLNRKSSEICLICFLFDNNNCVFSILLNRWIADQRKQQFGEKHVLNRTAQAIDSVYILS